MPNWCYSKYVITGSKEEINNLYHVFKKQLEDDTLPACYFGNEWLGNIVTELGADNTKMFCRGSFEKVKLVNKSTLKLATWTAWTPCYELFEYIIKKFPSLKYYFKAEEPGCRLFETNDSEKKFFGYGKKYDICDNQEMQCNLFWEVVHRREVYMMPKEEMDKAYKEAEEYIRQYDHDNNTENSIN